MRNRIPLSRGLGSSAAATIGGLIAGNTLLGGPLSPAELLKLATGIEGHADNAAAALARRLRRRRLLGRARRPRSGSTCPAT